MPSAGEKLFSSLIARIGSKHAILTDGQGDALVHIDTIPANTPDANQAVPFVDAVPSDRRQAWSTPGNAWTMRDGELGFV